MELEKSVDNKNLDDINLNSMEGAVIESTDHCEDPTNSSKLGLSAQIMETSEVNEADATTSSNSEPAAEKDLTKQRLENDDEDKESSIKNATQKSLEEKDPYFYLKRNEFTSEIFKIHITNLPRFGFSQLKKKIASYGIDPRKIKALANKHMAWVTFSSEEDRTVAIEKLDGLQWKNNKIKVKKADPSQDPLVKRMRELEADNNDEPNLKKAKVEESTEKERLRCAVSPLSDVPYEDQLKEKQTSMISVMRDVTKKLKGLLTTLDVRTMLEYNKSLNDGLCCELLPVKPSPVTELYRNKCEFNIGTSPNGQDNTIGHSFGLYKDGHNSIGNPQHLTLMPKTTLCVVKYVEKCIREGPYSAYNTSTHEGCWRTLTVRVHKEDEVMAILRIADKFNDDMLTDEKQRIASYFTDGPGKECPMKSFYFVQQLTTPEKRPEDVYEKYIGEDHLQENLLGMKFRISPDSFFQVNTQAAEVLYSQVRNLCNLTTDTVLLDVCCGTGTIGLTMASQVKKVIGIEMCKQAVDDAIENAKINGIKNATFLCSKVEHCIRDVISKHAYSNHIVAVVDPPRAGLHTSVIRCLRSCKRIDRLVYVSCSPKSAVPNFIDLMKSQTKRMKGDPFCLVKAVPVDLFPQTKLCELVLLFDRHIVNNDSDNPENTTVDRTQVAEVPGNTNVDDTCDPDVPGNTNVDNTCDPDVPGNTNVDHMQDAEEDISNLTT